MIKSIKFYAIASGIKQMQNSTANEPRTGYNNLSPDLAIVVLPDNSCTVGVFTQNIFCAAPIIVAKNHINNNTKALIINSGNANAGTGVASGDLGLKNAVYICDLAAKELGVDANNILPFSTGVIGQQLPMDCFENNIPQLLKHNATMEDVANAIMTTDTFAKIVKKQVVIDNKTINIIGIAKGSGMIRPNMATMLSFIFTDIKIDKKQLQQCLEIAVNQSFNRITVDGDTSTNDACTLSATGEVAVKIDNNFQQCLNDVSKKLALKIIKDGEGATKFVAIKVSGRKSKDCLQVAYTVAHSPLVKTALFASDANWGRILAAIGRSGIDNLSQNDVSIYLGNICLIKNGEIDINYSEQLGSNEMQKAEININIMLGENKISETVWTTDLSYNYIKINAEYRT